MVKSRQVYYYYKFIYVELLKIPGYPIYSVMFPFSKQKDTRNFLDAFFPLPIFFACPTSSF